MKDIDWKSLTFGYLRTDYNVRCYYQIVTGADRALLHSHKVGCTLD